MLLKELRDKRGKAINDARAILDKAEKEKRDVTDDEMKSWNAFMAEEAKLQTQIEMEERQQKLDREAAEQKLADDKRAGKETDTTFKTDDEKRAENLIVTFRTWLKSGRITDKGADEFRALQADVDVSGGFLVAPEQFVKALIKAVDDLVYIRQHATVIPVTTSDSLGAPSLDTDPADADWTSEIGETQEDSSLALGGRSMTPHPLSKLVKVSLKLMRVAAISPDQLVQDRLAYKFGITQEKGFLTGSGSNQPLGVFTASGQGISTSRDISDGNTETSIMFDGLINAKYGLKAQYWPQARWIFHRDAVKQIAKLKDGEGRYIWQESVIAGQPDKIMNLPFHMSEYGPNTFESGLYVGILGDFRNYWIVDSLVFQIQRLVEKYALTNQIGFIGRAELDGMPVLEEAFVRVKLG